MKKSLFLMAAASALMLTACTSESDVLQSATKQETPKAVGFDVYTHAVTNVTRAGLQGTMTTERLQRSEAYGGGFGVYAFLVEDADNTSGYDHATTYKKKITTTNDWDTPIAPNFMVNEKLLWNSVNQGWYYNPLKYWPNETDNDSQNTPATMEGPTDISTGHSHIDRLTFFAYAPYVAAGVKEPGITGVTANDGYLTPLADLTDPTAAGSKRAKVEEPSVSYYASLADADKCVDLLWGVAPSGGLTYTAVNGKTVNVKEGEPLMDMTKPNVNTNMKFLFQHALARINVKAVAAIDQVGAGGKLDPNTRITINNIKLKGYFGETGVLNLNNKLPNVANWVNINGVDLAAGTALAGLTQKTITIDNADIADHVRFIPAVSDKPQDQTGKVGVTTVLQNVIEPATGTAATKTHHAVSAISAAANTLPYSETTPYYTSWTQDGGISGAIATANLEVKSKTFYTYGQNGSIVETTYAADAADLTFQYPAAVNVYEATKEAGATAVFTKIDDSNKDKYANYQAYTRTGDASPYTYTPVADAVGKGATGTTYYVLTATLSKATPVFAAAGPYYKRDDNYFMVVPTNNVTNISSTIAGVPADAEALRTVEVEIEYYITTEDSKLADLRAQTKNVIVKKVVFPSLANGKSYNLNLVLGLTSVKMEAEVDDWKVINVQGDLPQNTAE